MSKGKDKQRPRASARVEVIFTPSADAAERLGRILKLLLVESHQDDGLKEDKEIKKLGKPQG